MKERKWNDKEREGKMTKIYLFGQGSQKERGSVRKRESDKGREREVGECERTGRM